MHGHPVLGQRIAAHTTSQEGRRPFFNPKLKFLREFSRQILDPFSMCSTVRNITEQLFEEARLSQEQHGRLTDELLSALYFVFNQPILHALDLVDRRNITRLVSPSGRVIHQVVGSSGQTYTCLKASSFCTCPSFTYTVLVKMESMMCKHLLAVNMAEAIHNIKEKPISNETLAAHLSYDC